MDFYEAVLITPLILVPVPFLLIASLYNNNDGPLAIAVILVSTAYVLLYFTYNNKEKALKPLAITDAVAITMCAVACALEGFAQTIALTATLIGYAVAVTAIDKATKKVENT